MGNLVNDDCLLSLGTVVKIENLNGDLMIVGRGILESDKNMYDYCAVPCPFGFSSPNSMIIFSSEAIIEVVHEGYTTENDKKLGKLTRNFINKKVTPEEYFSKIDKAVEGKDF